MLLWEWAVAKLAPDRGHVVCWSGSKYVRRTLKGMLTITSNLHAVQLPRNFNPRAYQYTFVSRVKYLPDTTHCTGAVVACVETSGGM